MTHRKNFLHHTLLSFLLFLLLTFLQSCGSNTPGKEDENPMVEKENQVDPDAEYEIYASNIDLNDSLKYSSSLYFTKQDGSSIDVTAFLNKKQEVVKLVEVVVDGPTNRYQKTTFYVKNGKKYISNEHYEDTLDKNDPMFTERITFYDENESPVKTRIRKAKFEENLNKNSFTTVDPYDCSIERALQAINQEGVFQAKFQGLIFSGRSTYITVGEDDKDGYISALLIQYENATTRKIRKNQNAMLGKLLDLNFQKVIDESGFEFQLLLGVKEAKKD
jgi:hypothetical protein